MKKIYFLLVIILISATVFGQSFSGPNSASNGSTITLTAVGEANPSYGTSNYKFTTLEPVNNLLSTTSSPAVNLGSFITVSLSTVTFFNNGTPTTIGLTLVNSYTQPVTVTFYLQLYYSTYSNNSNYVSIPYTVTIQPTSSIGVPPPTPVTFTIANDGNFIRDSNTQQIFIVFEGTLRYIPTLATLQGLFTATYITNYTTAQIAGNTFGVPFTSDNGLINDTHTGRVYLRESTNLRWISTLAIKQKYSFNWNSITNNSNGLYGYTILAPLTF